MSRRRLGGFVVLMGLVAGATLGAVAMGGDADRSKDRVPTVEEARRALTDSLRVAGSRDPARYCAATESPALRQTMWDKAGGDEAVPGTAPRVRGSRVQDGHRVLELCGPNGRGEEYWSDFPTYRSGEGVVALHPVFWLNLRLPAAEGGENATARPPDEVLERCHG